MKRLLCLIVAVFGLARPAHGYIDAAPTLGRLLNDSTNVVVLRVEKVSRDRRAIIFSKVADLKGKHPGERIKHRIDGGLHPRESKVVQDWAEPGKIAVCFQTGREAVTCIGPYWYQSAAQDDEWWSMVRGRWDLALAYLGSAERLREHVTAMLAGREVVITAIRLDEHGAKTYQAVYSKNLAPGTPRPVWRLRASLNMPGTVEEAANDRTVVGFGAGDAEDVPPLARALRDPEAKAAARAAAADDLARIGRTARAAVPALREALQDPDRFVRVRAAAALAQIDPRNGDALPTLIAMMKDADAPIRRAAVEAAGNLGPKAKSAVGELLRAARDDDPAVRWAAVEALGRVGPEAKAAVPLLTEALRDAALRVIAADALGGIGPAAAAAAPALTRALGEADPNLRWTAATALVRTKDPSAPETAAPVFVEALKSNDPRTRWDGVWYLEQLGPQAKGQVPALTALVKDGDPRVRGAALAALEKVGPEGGEALPALVEALKDGDPRVRLAAAQAVIVVGEGQTAAPDAAAVLAEALRKSDPRDRAYIQWYLWQAQPQDKVALPALIALLRDADAGVRSIALTGLQQLSTEAEVDAALPAISELLKDQDRGVRLAAAEALWQISEDAGPAVPVLVEALEDKDDRLRSHAARILGEVGTAARAALPALRAVLADKGAGAAVRIAAAEAVWRINADVRAAVPVLIEALKSKDDQRRSHAASVLREIGAAAVDAAPALRELLEEDTIDSAVRLSAAEALWQITHDVRTAMPVLIETLQNDEKDARIEAAAILEKIGPAAKDAVPALGEALNDPDEEVRSAAARALKAVDPLPMEPAGDGQPGTVAGLDRKVVLWVVVGAGFLLTPLAGWFLVRSRRQTPLTDTPTISQ
jgi:HEAT repeat protein